MSFDNIRAAMNLLGDELGDKDDKEFQLALYKIKSIKEKNKDLLNKKWAENQAVKKDVKKEIDTLELLLEGREESFTNLYDIGPLYTSPEAIKTLQKFTSADKYTLENLYSNLEILEARSGELKEAKKRYTGQKNEVMTAIMQDSQTDDAYFDPNEFTAFLNQKIAGIKKADPDKYKGPDGVLGTGDDIQVSDRELAGYRAAYQDWFGSNEALQLLRISKERKSQDTVSKDSRLTFNTLLNKSSKRSGKKRLEGNYLTFYQQMQDDGLTAVDKKYQEFEAPLLRDKMQLGTGFASLFEKVSGDKNTKASQAATYYQKFIEMHDLGSGEYGPYGKQEVLEDYSYFFDAVRESYVYYNTLDDKDKKKHDKTAARFFGYNASIMSFDKFATKFFGDYSAYTMKPLTELGIILPNGDNDDNDQQDEDWDDLLDD